MNDQSPPPQARDKRPAPAPRALPPRRLPAPAPDLFEPRVLLRMLRREAWRIALVLVLALALLLIIRVLISRGWGYRT